MKLWMVGCASLLVAGLLSACATTRGQAKVTGARALGCSVEDVSEKSFPGASYVISGCGHSVDVDCMDPRTVDRSQHAEEHTFCRAGTVR